MPVKCTFLLNGQADSVFSCEGTASVTAFSGTGRGRDNPDDTAIENVGPIPKGTYYLINRQSGGYMGFFYDWWNAQGVSSTDRRQWFMLWNPKTGDTTNIDGIKRGNFRLHPMGHLRLSHGCITVVNRQEFDRLQQFIRSRGQTVPVPRTALRAYGTVEVK
ncbi:uncharacterized protein DUF2778 [Paraburkholderia sp. BL18I3N2]|uniref:DUF2778 domain-containing protein n=1 Tax=Paraburkholderia sp. BL18I3N2 TaxID=1938799 RepID=UPI000D048FF0|nr:DUF2778 domain-containing protein [Paraburkholderia sp. BL18I3N2]PRX30755.1 uncharacterized protein DUF2778 [Paraburkholderia sp. BL18I3N2]